MPIGQNKRRVTFTVSNDMYDKMLGYSEDMGVSVSQMCAVLIGQVLMGYDRTFERVDKKIDNLLNDKK